MNARSLRLLGLQAYFAINRQAGWSMLLAGFLCLAGALSWFMAVPHMRAELAEQERTIKRLERTLQTASNTIPVAQKPQADEKAALFYEALGNRRFVEQQLKILLSIAKKTELSLNQAEYKSAFNKSGDFHTYQIILPVKGSYGAIRQFCELTLLVIPYASLDEMSFKREAVGKAGLEGKLRFTLYLSDKRLPVSATAERDTKRTRPS